MPAARIVTAASELPSRVDVRAIDRSTLRVFDAKHIGSPDESRRKGQPSPSQTLPTVFCKAISAAGIDAVAIISDESVRRVAEHHINRFLAWGAQTAK